MGGDSDLFANVKRMTIPEVKDPAASDHLTHGISEAIDKVMQLAGAWEGRHVRGRKGGEGVESVAMVK